MKYHITVRKRKSGGYHAWVIEKPGFFGYGSTVESAIGQLINFDTQKTRYYTR